MSNYRINPSEVFAYIAVSSMVAIASLLVPMFYDEKIPVTPFVIVGIIFLSNISTLIIRENTVGRQSEWLVIFLKRFVVSIIFSTILMIFYIYISIFIF